MAGTKPTTSLCHAGYETPRVPACANLGESYAEDVQYLIAEKEVGPLKVSEFLLQKFSFFGYGGCL